MFDSGFLEMLVIGIIALLVIGPERLPSVAAKVGKFIGKMKAFVATTREDIEKEIRADELRNMLIMQKEEINELRDIVKNTKNELADELSETHNLLEDNIPETKASIAATPDKSSKIDK
jgi:sec-independent protein translocase protein TatB